jgi:EAL domain-containing protein (putative c-di-GMP-specific phosphodiesterase class I)
MAQSNYGYLKLLFKNNLLLNPDEYELSDVNALGLVCRFLGMHLSSAFQPIFRADGKIIGREALLRPSVHEQFELLPEAAFEEAYQAGRLVQFDRLVRTIHLLNHERRFAEHELLFLNVHPRLLGAVNDHGRTFEQILHYYSVPTSQVVIEIRESAVSDPVVLAEAVRNYRNLGYKIAVDDFGLAQNGLKKLSGLQGTYERLVSNAHHDELTRVLTLHPDFVKLDGAVLADPQATGVIYSLVSSLRAKGILVVIEGIESASQLAIARKAGADFLQGNYLAYAETAPNSKIRQAVAEHLAA